MTEKEKKAINDLDKFADVVTVILPDYSTKIPEYCVDEQTWLALKKALNLIQKQDTEINKLKNVIDKIKDITKWLIIIPSRDKEGDYRPIKNTTAQECYKALVEIKELMKEVQ